MTRREKILMVITGFAALIGAAGFWGRGVTTGKTDSPLPGSDAVAKARGMRQSVKEMAVSRFEAALVASIGRSWRRASLYDKPLGGGAAPAATGAPRYTGYVELGSGRLAVVDGIEYQVGDRLEGGGYRVVTISPERVALEVLATGSHIDIPYEGSDGGAR